MKKAEKCEKRSLIGGQALMEGVMMRGVSSMAMAVRAPDGSIVVETQRLKKRGFSAKIPIWRGIAAFASSLVLGTKTLMKSAEAAFPDEEQPGKGSYVFATALGLILAVALFIMLPSFLASLINGAVTLGILGYALTEGAIRIGIFVLYLYLVSKMKDIRRTFMYHGAEHRTINCYEKGLDLTVENVQKCSTRHNRCGTTFLFFVMVVSILVFSLVTWLISLFGITDLNMFYKMLLRLALLPLVAGLSYELLRFLALLPDNWFVNIFRAPGLALQRLTTYPPEDGMAEVAIVSFKAVQLMDGDAEVKAVSFKQRRICDITSFVKGKLKSAGITDGAESEWLVAEILGIKRSEGNSVSTVSEGEFAKIKDAVAKRENGVPLDYITGRAYFYGLKLYIDEGALIPRADTEILAETVINNAKEGDRILDLMTGSGCIALAVKKNTAAEVTASDFYDGALNVAAKNLNGSGVNLIKSDIFKDIDGTFDIIVSNPPYIKTADLSLLQQEVKNEPVTALDGGDDGYKFYRLIAEQSPEKLNQGGMLALEMGIGQAEQVSEILTAAGFEKIEIIKDMSGIQRVVTARKKGV